MLQNSFLQHLLLFHKGTKCQTLRYGRWRSPHKCATKSKLKNTLLFALYETSSISFLYLLFVGNSCFFLLNQRLVFHKTSACFSQNDVLFYWKRRVVLLKMTCCFIENDVLFYWKRRVVFLIRWEEQKRTRGELRKQIGEKEHWNQEMNLWKYL